MDKLKQAKENIESLINIILNNDMESKRMYCYFPTERYDEGWDCDKLTCSNCRDKYYNKRKDELYKKYMID